MSVVRYNQSWPHSSCCEGCHDKWLCFWGWYIFLDSFYGCAQSNCDLLSQCVLSYFQNEGLLVIRNDLEDSFGELDFKLCFLEVTFYCLFLHIILHCFISLNLCFWMINVVFEVYAQQVRTLNYLVIGWPSMCCSFDGRLNW